MNNRRPVIVTTEFRGVFFGYAKNTSGKTIKLKNARNCLYWSKATGGFMGLASIGPQAGSAVGRRADIELRKVTAVTDMTHSAVDVWEGFPDAE